ncbi:hypothetical protein ANN_04084 [Periplaneta americana]|uniref:Mos1 transposase HTH domain-containing protein n=1 Tax=Periplaneta americana TaxID=6978 RepID=A0ABQ8T7K8_PERAM|nr:hypothetical protein ANN_04084 [Periplaneta americana]
MVGLCEGGNDPPGSLKASKSRLWSEMEALILSPAACEVRSVIKFFNAQSIAPIEIHRQLCQVYRPNIMSKQMVRRWCRQFSEGRQSVHDEERSGRPSLINDDRVELVRQCLKENRRFTITELSSHFPQISRSLLHEIVTKHLLFKKVCARWVPKNLTPEHKMQRLGAALTFLQRYHDDGDEFFDRIVTGDETWISHFTPETKQQSMHWRHSGSQVRTKFKQTLSVRKVMCTVFWDRKGILLIDFLPRAETVNADRYCETLRKLRRAIQNKRRGMLTAGVVLLHDNARPHTARRTAAVLTEFGWQLFLIIHPTVLILLPAIFTFSCTSRNSCPPRVLDYTLPLAFDSGTKPRRTEKQNTGKFAQLLPMGTLKDTVYATKPQTLDELRVQIEHACKDIPLATIQLVG